MPIIRNAGTFDLPARPRLLQELAEVVGRESTTVDQVADKVEADPGLAAAVVKSSNSVLHGPRGATKPITSVRQAVSVLGLKDLYALATGAFIRRAFPSSTPQIEQLWARSAEMAEACAQLAQGRVARDVAYSFGLFRFVGCAVLLMQAPGYRKTFELLETPEFAQEERARHGITHSQVGASFVVRWGMAREMVEAVGAAADIELLENLSVSPEARVLLAVGALAQLRLMPVSVNAPESVQQACGRVLGRPL